MVQIIYEDNHIIVAVKPQNMPSCEDSSKDPDMLSYLKEYIKKEHNKPGNVFLGLVHRLDRPTGGVMVFAKTSKAAARLSAQVRDKIFQKTYLCIASAPIKKSGTICDYLLKDKDENISKVVSENTPGAKYAELYFEKLSEKDGFALLKINLKTGRSHQIRVQLANIKSPVAGDMKYFGKKSEKLCLWAESISFFHPTTKEKLTFEADFPSYYPWSLFK